MNWWIKIRNIRALGVSILFMQGRDSADSGSYVNMLFQRRKNRLTMSPYRGVGWGVHRFLENELNLMQESSAYFFLESLPVR